MELVKIELEIPKESYELAKALAKLVKTGKEALKDGAQAADLPVVLGALMSSEVAAGIQGLDKIGAEWEEHKIGVMYAIAIAIGEIK